jgi:hypothetical protein
MSIRWTGPESVFTWTIVGLYWLAGIAFFVLLFRTA